MSLFNDIGKRPVRKAIFFYLIFSGLVILFLHFKPIQLFFEPWFWFLTPASTIISIPLFVLAFWFKKHFN